MGSSGRSQLGPAKRCGTALFGKLVASGFWPVVAPRKGGSALGVTWCDSRGYRKPRADWIPALLISSGISGYGKNVEFPFLEIWSRLFDPVAKFTSQFFSIRFIHARVSWHPAANSKTKQRSEVRPAPHAKVGADEISRHEQIE